MALSRKVAFGEPLDEATKVGAIVSPEHQAKIDGYVKGAVAAGATVRLGGAPLEVPGLGGQFYQPTVVAGVTPDMAIAQEEVFGPVLSVLTFRTLDEAVVARERRVLRPVRRAFGARTSTPASNSPGGHRRAPSGPTAGWTALPSCPSAG